MILTPLQKLETATQTLIANQNNFSVSLQTRQGLIAGAMEVLAECAVEALPSIQEAIRKNKERSK